MSSLLVCELLLDISKVAEVRKQDSAEYTHTRCVCTSRRVCVTQIRAAKAVTQTYIYMQLQIHNLTRLFDRPGLL